MLQAKQISYDNTGNRQEEVIEVHDALDAWQLCHKVYQKEPDAYCLARNEFDKDRFVVRVMTKEKVIFKIQTLS